MPCLCSINGCTRVRESECDDETEACKCKIGFYQHNNGKKTRCRKAKGKLYPQLLVRNLSLWLYLFRWLNFLIRRALPMAIHSLWPNVFNENYHEKLFKHTFKNNEFLKKTYQIISVFLYKNCMQKYIERFMCNNSAKFFSGKAYLAIKCEKINYKAKTTAKQKKL